MVVIPCQKYNCVFESKRDQVVLVPENSAYGDIGPVLWAVVMI